MHRLVCEGVDRLPVFPVFVTYLHFHFVFILPIIFVLALLVRRHALILPHPFTGIALLCAIATVYTTPWDDYLIAIGIWTHQEGRTLGINIGRIPVEEFAFFFLQPLLTGLFMQHFAAKMPGSVDRWMTAPWSGRLPRLCGAGVALAGAALGGAMIWQWSENWTYLGLILVWACPVLAFQWALGGNVLWVGWKFLFTCLAGPTVYLWVVDLIAIEWGIWSIAPQTSTGFFILSLPVEEAVFFLVTNLMVVTGLMLYFRALREWSARKNRRVAQ